MSAPTDLPSVLVIDDDRNLAEALAESLTRKGYVCTVATSGKAGADKIQSGTYDVVLTDLKMSDLDGLAIVRLAKERLPDAAVVVITGHGDVKTAVEAMRLGAVNFLEKPVDIAALRAVVEKATERVQLNRTNQELRRQLDEKFGFEGVVGNSPKMQQVIRLLKAYAPTSATVLVLGENGTGKELVAKALHTNSPRRNKPFVAMNCAALNENLLDDEMFGHEEGSFTGAKGARKGRFEYANGGTLFLDEIGDMPLALQAKLLRVLENGEVVRIGANTPIKVDVRVIAATNRDLEAAVKEGRFRRDLYHRLKVGVIRLPALWERKEDIPLLMTHFLKELAGKVGRPMPKVAEEVRRALAVYHWPGNVRELRNLLESMILLDTDGVLGMDDIPPESGLDVAVNAPAGPAGPDFLVGRPLAEVERYYVQRAIEVTGGKREEAAKLLGIGGRTLYRMFQRWEEEKRQAKKANGRTDDDAEL
jgi:two-component system response regulator HydG